MNLEFKLRPIVFARFRNIAFRSIKSNGAVRVQNVTEQPGRPAWATPKINCETRPAHIATPEQFASFGFIQLGEMPQPGARRTIVSKGVIVCGDVSHTWILSLFPYPGRLCPLRSSAT